MRRLNAPYGARCFLTNKIAEAAALLTSRLNAPYGARCFLTLGGNGSIKNGFVRS